MALSSGRRFFILGWIAGLILICGLIVWFLTAVHIVASILAISILFAYVLLPLVEFFARPLRLVIPAELKVHPKVRAVRLREEAKVYQFTSVGMPRVVAILVVYLLVGITIAIAFTYLMPVIHEQFAGLTENLSSMTANLQSTLERQVEWFQSNAPVFARPWASQIHPDTIRLEDFAEEVRAALPGVVGATFSGVKFVGGVLATGILVPLFSFYLLLDGDRYSRAFMRLVPKQWKVEVKGLIGQVDQVLGRYIRGQLLVCSTIGVSIALILSIMGVDYAILIGVFAGVVDIIPYVGVAIGLVPAFVIALLQKGVWFAVAVVVVMEIVHWTEGHIIVPAVIGHSVGLPPLVVMVALGAGAELGGIMGMVLAIPAAAIISVLGKHYADRLEAAESEGP